MEAIQYSGLLDWIRRKLEQLKYSISNEGFVTRFKKVEPLRCPGCFRCFDSLTRWINCSISNPRYNLEIKDGYLVITYKTGSNIYYYRVPNKYCTPRYNHGRLQSCSIAVRPTIVNPKDLYLVLSNGVIVYKAREVKSPPETEKAKLPQLPPANTPIQIPPHTPKQIEVRNTSTNEGNYKKYLPFLLGGLIIILLLRR